MYSKIILIGNLGNMPEMRYTPGGDPVTSMSLAVNKVWTKDGVKQEKTTWVRVTTWRKLAETVAQYCKKGDRVLVEGEEIEARAFADKSTNEPRAALEMTALTVRFLTPKGEAVEMGTSAPAVVPGRTVETEEDIPF